MQDPRPETRPPTPRLPRARARLSSTTLMVLVAALVGLGGVAAITRPAPDPDGESTTASLEVATSPLVRESGYTVARRFTGRIEARRASRVGFELGGTVVMVAAEEGERVSAGQLLARLDARLLDAGRAEQVAAEGRAWADLRLAEATLDRHRRAIERQGVSPQALDEAERQRDAAAAGAARAAAAVEALDVRLDKSRLVAPYDAWIAARHVDEGQVVEAGTPIVDLLEDAPAEARIGLPAEVAADLAPGSSFPLEVDRGDAVTVGRLRSLAPRRDEQTRVVDAVFELEVGLGGGPAALRHGDLVHLLFERREPAPGFELPLAALIEGERGLWAAYVVRAKPGEQAIVERRPVEVLLPGERTVFVRGALDESERVVVAGAHRLVPGLAVRVADAESDEVPR
ncbi:MAG: efflux RND transporter periplasmic adaptor subunit [Acidobacteriota bacterium]